MKAASGKNMLENNSIDSFGRELWSETELPVLYRLLLTFIRAGLSRGKVKKAIHKLWLLGCGDSPIDTTVRGAKYRLDFRDNTPALKVLFASSYDTKELAFLYQASHSGGIFVDIGANIGYYTVDMAVRDVNVIAIEPNPAVVNRLLFNLNANNITSKVIVEELCVAEPGVHTLSFKGYGTGSLIALHGPGKEIQVKGDTLQNILLKNNISKVSSLKIDIEGAEDDALIPFFKNAPRTMWPACAVIEHCNRNIWKTDLIQCMIDRGYEIKLKKRANTVLMLKDPN
jgi:FkbM family methyltransferase